jgi:exodeoxyribonuclease V alpha subunit
MRPVIAAKIDSRYDTPMPPPAPDDSRAAETLRGTVERVTFHSEDTGYCILKVLPEGRSDIVALIGKAPRVVPGEHVEALGTWERSRDFGPQFKASELRLKRPDSMDGMERYLASGLIEGIGPSFAKRVIKKFGSKTFEIIENESARLEEVEGIGTKRRREIRSSWMKQKAVHGIMLFLHQHGITPSRALRIYKTYGDEAMDVLQKNPYRLAEDIRGIGFKTADEIAQQVGLAANAPERLRAGLLHIVEEAARSGHTCVPEEKVIKDATALLGADEMAVGEEATAVLLAGDLERHDVDGQSMFYLPYLRGAEMSIARALKELQGVPPTYPTIQVDAALEWAARTTGKALATSQAEAVRSALAQRVLIITGGPGVGKTTILRTVLSILGSKAVKIVLAAPTGRAAKRMTESTGLEAKTLHRLLEFQGEGGWGRHRGKPLVGDLFVVDEASMIDAPLMAQFLSALPQGAHLLIVGDADQLPSVGPGMVLNDLINSGAVPCVRLTEIFRQAASSRIITSAHDINQGRIPDLKSHADSDFFFLAAADPEQVRDVIVDLVKRRLPAKYGFDPLSEIQVLTPMNRNLLGTQSLNQALQSALNPPNEIKYEVERFGCCFRVGDRVIQTQNNYDKDIFNGDLGHIVAIETDPLKVDVRFDGQRLVSYEPGELDELQLAYALTVHKSQGSEFPCVVMPISTQHYVLLERSLLYTGITRARKLVVLVGDERALSLAINRQESRKRWTGLRQVLTN